MISFDQLSSIDLHMHSTLSDGTDEPQALLDHVKQAGIELFSVTDHDSIKSVGIFKKLRTARDPYFISGVEFSCKDEEGKYHILGYGYDPASSAICDVVAHGHALRIQKLTQRLDHLKQEFGFAFTDEERAKLMALDNPGKPHIASLMISHGYAKDIPSAIRDYMNRLHIPSVNIRPEDAIFGIRTAGGIPVLAHPFYGSGDQLILGNEMDGRIQKLMRYGLEGMECYYSGFTERLQHEALSLADKHDLYVTAGSDCHGSAKMVALGDTGLGSPETWPDGLRRFLQDVKKEMPTEI